MKPDYHSAAHLMQRAGASAAPAYPAPRSTRGRADEASAGAPLDRIRARFLSWWRTTLAQREQRMRLEALASLGSHMLEDTGVSEELRSHALAQRESQFERLARSAHEMGGAAGRFGPW